MAEVNDILSVRNNGTSELFDIKKAKETYDYDERKAYTEGIKYYYGIITDVRAVRADRGYYPIIREFGEHLKKYEKTEDIDEIKKMSELFGKFFPDGNISMLFVSVGLTFAFDGISEYLMHLKKLYLIRTDEA